MAEALRNLVASVTGYGSAKGVVTQSTTSFRPTCLRVAKNILIDSSTMAIARRTRASFSGVQQLTSTTRGPAFPEFTVAAEWGVPEITRTSQPVLSPPAIAVR